MREYIFSVLDSNDNIHILDSTDIDWSKFAFKKGYFEHYLTTQDIIRPDLLSFTYYKSTEYWDIILLVNNIDTIFDVMPDTKILIPHLEDIKDFIRNKGYSQ